jgi:bacteriocin-like protein
MSGTKEFFALLAKDKDVKLELGTESLKALKALLEEKGLKDEAHKALDEAVSKVAKAHGFDFGAMEELSEDELKAVAGGWNCTDWANEHLEKSCVGNLPPWY